MSIKSLIIFVPMLSGVIYHFGQKRVSENIPASLLFSIIYFLAMINLLIFYFLIERNGPVKVRALMSSDWQNIVLIAFGAIGIELGYLYVYRAGLPMNSSVFISTTGQGILLLLLGTFFFAEKISMYQIGGLVLAAIGLLLLQIKS